MTTTKTKPATAARKGSPTKTAAKATKSTPKTAPKSTKSAATKPAPRVALAQLDAARLVKLQDAARKAQSVFELAVCEQLTSDVSPTHIAAALGIAGSSVRRIGMRNGLAIK